LPIYDLSAVAHALDIPPKQLDNMLSRNELHGVERKRRGVTRRITVDAAVVINLASQLSNEVRVPIAAALALSSQLVVANGSLGLGEFLAITVDLLRLRANTITRLDSAVEAVGRRRRGRPPGRATRQ
jgi:hypothetical protein